MILEYPSYFEKFRCIGGQCSDTCCAGWEVDVDECSADYYKNVPGTIGSRLRRHLQKDGENSYFPLTHKGRCPFLRKDLLCDLYIELGEESLCQTCTEYPRYYMGIGAYEQIDLSLSCIELSRIFFTESGPITYLRDADALPGKEIDTEEQETLVEVLALRNHCIAILQEHGGSLEDRLQAVRDMVSEAQGLTAQDGDAQRRFLKEDAAAIVARMKQFDSIRPEWDQLLQSCGNACSAPDFRTRFSAFSLKMEEQLDLWFTRLAVYFIYRYFIDTCIDGDIEIELCLVHRALRMLRLLLYTRWTENASLILDDVIYIAHLFSKETEHDEDNVALLKA